MNNTILIDDQFVLVDALETARAVLENHFGYEHGREDVGKAWGKIETALEMLESNKK